MSARQIPLEERLQGVPLPATDSKLILTINPAIGSWVRWRLYQPVRGYKTDVFVPGAPRLLTTVESVGMR